MNIYKPEMSIDEANELLNQLKLSQIDKLAPIEIGEASKVFSFTKNE